MKMYSNNLKFMFPSRNISFKIIRLVVISEYKIIENNFENLASNDDIIDFAHRSDNVLLMSPVNVVLVCTATLTDGAYTVEQYKQTNYNNCRGTCFIVDLNIKNIRIMSLAVWYKKNKTREVNETFCSNRIIKLNIFTFLHYSKQICKDSFMREDNSNINMLYANCNQEDKLYKLLIDIDTKNVHVVEIAVYNKWIIEHLPLKCVNNNVLMLKDSIIDNKKLKIIPWNLIVDAIQHGFNESIDKTLMESYYKVSKGITDNNIFSCFLFNFKRRNVLFIFDFNVLVLLKSIIFITGLSLENNTLFMINQYSNIQDAQYRKKLNNINECNIKLEKDISITYNG